MRNCCIINCKSRSHDARGRKLDNRLRFFKIPKVKKTHGPIMEGITKRRRLAWVAAIHRPSITFSDASDRLFVCSRHFHSGEPAYEMFDTSPDWAPCLYLGHKEHCKTNSDVERYQRLEQRKRLKRETEAMAAIELAQKAQKAEEARRVQEAEDEARRAQEVAAAQAAQEEVPKAQVKRQASVGYGEVWQARSMTQGTCTTAGEEVSCSFCKLRRDEINRLLEENRKLKEELKKKSMDEEFLQDDANVKYYTGLPSLPVFAGLLESLLPFLPQGVKRVLNPFKMFLVTLMRLRLDLPIQHVAHLFGVSRATANRVFSETVCAMYAYFNPSVCWPDREILLASMPHKYVEALGNKVAVIINFLEIQTEKPSKSDVHAQSFSVHKLNHTQKYLIGSTPQGVVCFISKGWGNGTSEKHIIENSGFLNTLVPGDIVLAERGFDMQEWAGFMCAEIKESTSGGCFQMQPKDAKEARKINHLRLLMKKAIGCLHSKYTILSTTVPNTMLLQCEGDERTLFDNIVFACCALNNICTSVRDVMEN